MIQQLSPSDFTMDIRSHQRLPESVPVSGNVLAAGDVPSIPAIDILGIRVHSVSLAEAVSLMSQMAHEGGGHHVVTVNPEFVMSARKNQEFREVLNNASLAIPDGIGILWAGRILGSRFEERVPGVDCVWNLAGAAERSGHSLFLLGAAPGVAEEAAARLRNRFPALRIAGTYAGSPHPDDEEKICRILENSRPDILLVAYGSPNQDLWISRTRTRLMIPLAMGVGGTFDFIAGVARRAPTWVQALGLEWLHRLIKEPYRWRRMLALPRFALCVFQTRFRKRKSSRFNGNRTVKAEGYGS